MSVKFEPSPVTAPNPTETHDLGAYAGTDVLEIMAEARNYNAYLAALIERQLRPGMRVLDFGAGVGTFAEPLARRAVDVICVETDAGQRERLIEAGLQAFAGLDEIAPESLDFVYTLNVLEHIADDAAAMRALADRLKPGGVLLVYVPAFEILYSAFDWHIGHLRRYRRNELAALAAGAGLRATRLCYADSAGFLAALLYRALGRHSGDISRRAIELFDRMVFPVSRLMDIALSQFFGKNLLLVAEKAR